MGQAGSTQLAPAPRRYHHALSAGGGVAAGATLPHEPLRHAPKVLPSLETSPRLRCTDNGAILHSGGTISGRRALSATLPTHAQHAQLARTKNQHVGVYRSRSASSGEQSPPNAVTSAASAAAAAATAAGRLTRERDPLHRSHTHLDFNPLELTISKRFGSEPDLRNEEEQTKQRGNKHFRKKYKAPPPPSRQQDERDNSSPDSCEGSNRNAPARKLRLFKTRSETKKLNGQTAEMKNSHNIRQQPHKGVVNSRSENQSLERQYKPACMEKDQFVKYPDSRDRDMIQSSSSLRIEEHLLQASGQRNDYRRCKNDKSNAYRSKAHKNQDNTDARKTPHLDRTFRYSERFSKKAETDPPVLRREKSFDATLVARDREELGTRENENHNRIKVIGDQLKSSRLAPLAPKDKQLRKSLPSLLAINNEEKDEFQAELKRATNRIRTESILNPSGGTCKLVQESKPSQNNRQCNNKCSRNNHPNTKKSIPIQNIKVKESSPRSNSVLRQESSASKSYNNDKRSPMRNNQTEAKKLIEKQNALNRKLNNDVNVNRQGVTCARESRSFADRGQASGKESTPEQSPNRLKGIEKFMERENTAPSKQFYFGMIESKEVDINENLKDFPGLGSPIIEEFSNFHIIERKLLGYHDKQVETDKFITRLPSNDNNVKNVSSESALSSSEEEVGSARSAESRGIALHLRPTLPKKQLEIPRFSPAAAWRQLAQVETEPDMQQALAVEIKTPIAVESPAESPHRSDKSADKSGDSGISGDHAHSDQRLDSPPRPHVARGAGATEASAWTPQQDLEGDSGSDGAGGGGAVAAEAASRGEGLVTYSARGQPFSLSLPRDRQPHDKNKQFQQPFNSLQKLKKSVSGALGAALGSRRFDLEHEPILDEPSEQNWFLSKSAPNSLTNPFLYQHNSRPKGNHEGDIKEEPTPPNSDQDDGGGGVRTWSSAAGGGGGGGGGGGSGRNASYLSWGGHVMYLPPAPAQGARAAHDAPHHTAQPLSLLLTSTHPERPTRSKSSGEIELRSRAARAARELKSEMRERERSASPTAHSHAPPPPPAHTSSLARALPARVVATTPSPPNAARGTSGGGGARTKAKRFTFQSTVRQLERRRIAEKLSREADLKEQQRRTELEAMRRVEEEFQRKRAREKASIRQQLRLVSGANSLPPLNHQKQARDDPDGAVSPRDSPAPESAGGGSGGGGEGRIKHRERRDNDDREHRHSNASSEISGRSKSTTPVRCVELSEWREGPGGGGGAARQYRDWGAPPGTQVAHNIAHPPACYRMPKSPAPVSVYLNANGKEAVDTFSGSPRSDNYRLEFARGVPRSPRTPRAPRHPLASRTSLVPHSPSSSSSELSTSVGGGAGGGGGAGRQAIRLREIGRCEVAEPAIVPTLQPAPAAPRRLRTPLAPAPLLTATAALR